MLLLCSHSSNDVPPEPQRNVSIAAVRGAVRPSIGRRTYKLTNYVLVGSSTIIRTSPFVILGMSSLLCRF